MASDNTFHKLEEKIKEKRFRIINCDNLEPLKDISSGAFGKVCIARDKQRHDIVAVKVLDIRENFSHCQIETFIKEAEIMYMIRDQHVLDIYGVCYRAEVLQPFYSLVLPHMENGSVGGLFRSILDYRDICEEPIHVSWALRTRILYQVASGMLFLHNSDILHLDLKASNVLLNEDFKVKIADFGLSRIYTGTVGTRTNSTVGGTPTHIPPEYIKDVNKKPNQQFDMYSYGIFTWEVLTGAQAYAICQNVPHLQWSVCNGCRPDESLLPGDLPEQYTYLTHVVTPLMKQSWDEDPHKRKSMKEVKDTLEPYYTAQKRKAQEDVPVLLKQLSDAIEMSKQKDNGLSQITKNVKNLTLEDFVNERLYSHDSVQKLHYPEQNVPSFPVHDQNQLKQQNLVNKIASSQQQYYPQNIPNQHNAVQQAQTGVMPSYAVHPMQAVYPNVQPPVSKQYSEVSQDAGSFNRHIHRQPSSASQSYEIGSASNLSDVNKDKQTGREFPGACNITQGTSAPIVNNVYHITGSNSVHIGPTYSYHKNENIQSSQVTVNENPDLVTNNVHVKDLKEEVSDDHLQKIARHLGSNYWRLLGRQCLLFTDGELDAFASDYYNEGLIETIYQMFRKWKEKHGHKATREWLATSLVYVNKRDLIDNILNVETN